MTGAIKSSEPLTQDQMYQAMSGIMAGQWQEDEIFDFLVDLSERGETIEEITGAARVMREKALSIIAPEGAVDCCGTGGDKAGTFNISTAVAIVTAACGVPVAKHGNRSASSNSGAADVLEALGVNLDVGQDDLEEALRVYNFAFLMAPNHHAAMKHVVPVRRRLGRRTIFNILGPLSNPAKTKRQLLGVFNKDLVLPIAEVLRNLGTVSAWVVHGSDGLDEITTTAETYVAKLENNSIEEVILTPEDFGVERANPKDLVGGTPEVNAKALLEILQGKKNAYRDIVVVNTAAVLMIAEQSQNLKDATQIAESVLDDGSAFDLLSNYREFTQTHGTI